MDPALRIRTSETPAALLATCRDVGLTGPLEDDVEAWFDWGNLSVRAETVLVEELSRLRSVTVDSVLGDEALWERLRRRAGGPQYIRMFYGLRERLAVAAAKRKAAASAAAPTAGSSGASPDAGAAKAGAAKAEAANAGTAKAGAAKRAEPHRPIEPGPGIAATDLVAWARERGVEKLLSLPTQRVPGAMYAPATSAYFYYQRNATVTDTLTARPAKSRADTSAGDRPPESLGQLVARWLVEQAERQAKALAEDAAARARCREPSDVRLRAAWERILGARDALRPQTQPILREASDGARISFVEDPPGFRYTQRGNSDCGDTWHDVQLAVRLDGDAEVPVVTCNCSKAERARCGIALAALDSTLAWLEGRLPGSDTAPVARVLATPAWSRTLADLDGLAPAEPDGERGEIGWAVELVGGAPNIWPLRCTTKKKGGWKLAKATPAEVLASEGPTSALDRLVLDAIPQRSYEDGARDRVGRALERLAGHPRLFAGGKVSAPMQIRVATLGFRVVATGDGGARLAPAIGTETIEPARLTPEGGAVIAGGRILRWDADRGVLTVVRASDAARQVVATLMRRGASFPPEAVPELVRRLPAISRFAPVQAGDMVRRVPAEPRPLVRMEMLPEDLLRVELRVRPRPGLAPQVPGEPPAEIFVRDPEGVASILRDLAAEVTDAHACVATVPLGAPLPEEPFTWQVDEPERVLDVLAALQAMPDLDVEWAGSPKRVASVASKDLRVVVGTAKEWFAVGGELSVEGTALPMAQLLAAIAARRTFVKVDERTWIRLERRFREQLEPLADAAEGGALTPVNAPLLLTLEESGARVEAPKRWTELLDRVRAAATYVPELPTELRAELRPYQREGFAWLARLATWAEGALLADDMGLGKTVQTLALLLHRGELGPALVVAPTSVGFNWVRQAERFAPGLKVTLARGADRPREDDVPGPMEVVVTSYDLLVRDVEVLAKTRFATLVLDEAQAIKNPDTLRAKAARALQADFRVGLSGTPLENRTGELWSLFAVIAPGVLGLRERFRTTYALPIEKDGDVDRRRALARRIRPFVLRRLKSEVARDLPERTEVRVDVDLGADERGLYDAARVHALSELSQATGPEQQKRIQVLAALTRLRQIACHPRLLDPDGPPSSAKLERLVELLRELREEGRRTLVFSQFVRQLQLVRERLDAEGFRLRWLDGSTPVEERRAEVDAFQRGDGDVFLLSLKAGGTGIDLTAASDVVLLDPWWNPAVEDQAADRAHRIGQTRAVTVYRLVAADTVEERILALHEQKRDLVSSVLEGTGSAAALTTEELLELLRGDEEVRGDDGVPPVGPPAAGARGETPGSGGEAAGSRGETARSRGETAGSRGEAAGAAQPKLRLVSSGRAGERVAGPAPRLTLVGSEGAAAAAARTAATRDSEGAKGTAAATRASEGAEGTAAATRASGGTEGSVGAATRTSEGSPGSAAATRASGKADGSAGAVASRGSAERSDGGDERSGTLDAARVRAAFARHVAARVAEGSLKQSSAGTYSSAGARLVDWMEARNGRFATLDEALDAWRAELDAGRAGTPTDRKILPTIARLLREAIADGTEA